MDFNKQKTYIRQGEDRVYLVGGVFHQYNGQLALPVGADGTVLFYQNGTLVAAQLTADLVGYDGAPSGPAAGSTDLDGAVDALSVAVGALGNSAIVPVLNQGYNHISGSGAVTLIDTSAAASFFDEAPVAPGTAIDGVTSVQAALEALNAQLATVMVDALTDNGDGTFTHIANDGSAVLVNYLHTLLDNADGTYTFTDPLGAVAVINTNANSNPYAHAGTGTYTPGAVNVAQALQLLDAGLTALGSPDALVDNGDGTYSHTANDGTITAINTNANSNPYAHSGAGTYTVASINVAQALQALDAGLTALGSPDSLVDNADGTFTHTANDGTVTAVNFLHTVTPDGLGNYNFVDPLGNIVVIETTAASNPYAHAGSGTNTVASTNSGQAIQELDAQLTLLQAIVTGPDALVDNGDGTFTHTAVDGTVTTMNVADALVDNGDGTYTFTNSFGGGVTSIDTRASSNAYVHAGTGTVTAADTTVEAALRNLDAAITAFGSDSLVDNGNGTLTHTSVTGVATTFNSGWTQLVQNPTTGVVTVGYPDGTSVNFQGMPTTPATSPTPVPGTYTVADGTNASYPQGTVLFG